MLLVASESSKLRGSVDGMDALDGMDVATRVATPSLDRCRRSGGFLRIERPQFAAADEYAQARPRRAAELFGERHRFGIAVELRVDEDGCAVIEEEANIVRALAVAGGVDHRASDERRRKGRGWMTFIARCGHQLRVATACCPLRLLSRRKALPRPR
jgi:hypothetical protein